MSKLNTSSFPKAFDLEDERLNNELEEFFYTLFYHVLKINPKDKLIVLTERLGSMRRLNDALNYVLFKKFQVKGIFNLLSNAMPLYAIGIDTGLSIEAGF